MLKNIIKYEWKSISLKLIIVHIAMILFCGLSIVAIQKWNTSMLVFIFTFFYFICTVAAGLMTALIPAVRIRPLQSFLKNPEPVEHPVRCN
jgi:hypothetical protein